MIHSPGRKIAGAFSCVGMIWGGFSVAYPEIVEGHKWIGFVSMAAGLIGLVWVLFFNLEIRWPLKLTLKFRRPWRIPLLDLYQLADAKGWNFLAGGNLTMLDFASAFRQGALDGRFPVWGRALQALDILTEDEPLVPIPQDHWRTHEFDAIRVMRYSTNGQAVGFTKENLDFRTKTIPASMHHGCFADLQVKRKEAMRWLRRDAREFLGKTEKSDGNW